MGTTHNNRSEILKGPETLLPYFEPFGKDHTVRFGSELEVYLMSWNPAQSNFKLASADHHFALVDKIRDVNQGRRPDVDDTPISYSDEPGSHMVEVKDETPLPENQIGGSARNISRQLRCMTTLAREADPNLILSPFAVVSFSDNEEALANLIPPRDNEDSYIDRPRELMNAFDKVMPKEAKYYPVINTAVHITHSTTSLRHAFEMSKIQAALMPFSFLAYENRPPYQGNRAERVMIHTGISSRQTMRGRGVIQDFIYAARDENEMIDSLITDVLETPMLTYYDKNGDYRAVPDDMSVTPNDMKGLGPETVSQFEMAMSGKWGPIKYKLAQNDKVGMLHELRDYDSGPDVIKNATLLMGMFIMNEQKRQELFHDLDEIYGIPLLKDPDKARTIIKANMDAALHRGDIEYLSKHHDTDSDRHMDVPFGANGHTMMDLLNDTLMPMMEDYYEGRPESDMLDTWRFIADTGQTNSQFWYDRFESLNEQRRKIRALTKDAGRYHRLYASGKSFAQLYENGDLPELRKTPPFPGGPRSPGNPQPGGPS